MISTIGSVCRPSQYGWTTSAAINGKLPLLRSTDISSGQVEWDTVPYCEVDPDDAEKYILGDGDILITRAGAGVGKSYLIKTPIRSVFASYLIRFRPLIEPSYLQYFLRTVDYWIQVTGSAAGIAIPNLNATKISAVRLPVAPLAEQQRIVAKIDELFSRIDAGEQALKKVQALLKTYRQSVLKAAVTGELTKAWREQNVGKSESGHDLLKRILTARREAWEAQELVKLKAKGKTPKDDGWKKKYKEPASPDTTDLSDLPEGWAWATIEQMSNLITDGDHNPPKRVAEGIPHLTAKNIRDGSIDMRGCSYVTEEGFAQTSGRYLPLVGDLLVTCVGTIGRTAIVPTGVRFSADRNLAAIRCVGGVAAARFLELCLNSPRLLKRLMDASGATAQPHLYLGDLKRIVVPIPSTNEQLKILDEIGRYLSASFRAETDIANSAVVAIRCRQSVLRAAFSGGLVSQDSSDEPASILLARITAERAGDRDSKIRHPPRKSSKQRAAE